MRAFHFKAEYNQLLTPEVVAYLTRIHEYKGQQNLFIEAKADALSNLLEVAKIQSTEASNRIEEMCIRDSQEPAHAAVAVVEGMDAEKVQNENRGQQQWVKLGVLRGRLEGVAKCCHCPRCFPRRDRLKADDLPAVQMCIRDRSCPLIPSRIIKQTKRLCGVPSVVVSEICPVLA